MKQRAQVPSTISSFYKEICAILPAYYGRSAEESKQLNHVLVQMLSELIKEIPENIVASPVSAVPGAAQTTKLV